MGGACRRVWLRGEEHTGIWWENLRNRDNLVDPCVDGRIILRWTFRKWDGVMDSNELAQDWDRWQAIAVMDCRFP